MVCFFFSILKKIKGYFFFFFFFLIAGSLIPNYQLLIKDISIIDTWISTGYILTRKFLYIFIYHDLIGKFPMPLLKLYYLHYRSQGSNWLSNQFITLKCIFNVC